MNRVVCAFCVVGLVVAVIAGLGAVGPAPAGQPTAPAVPGERRLEIPAGKYTLLVFTNPGPATIEASVAIARGDLAFMVAPLSTLTLPLGQATMIPPNSAVKYRVKTVTDQPPERAPAGPKLLTLTGWGAAEGVLVGFVAEEPRR